MIFSENINPIGHLEVWKHFPDGTKELHFSDRNVICSGMGATLAEMFDAPVTVPIEEFQIIYFQVGASGALSNMVSSTGSLSGALSVADYGAGNLRVVTHDMIKDGSKTTSHAFGSIPYSYIKRVTPTKCLWQIVLDEQTANVSETAIADGGQYLSEIGIYSKNPFRESKDASMLCAYKFFKPVYKTDAFILVFRWTIEF